MDIAIAVDRLYDFGWDPTSEPLDDLERLPDGRVYPSVCTVVRLFEEMGLALSIKQNFMFDCHHATWEPIEGEPAEREPAEDSTLEPTDGQSTGTVVGRCEREAAVSALAHLMRARVLS